MTVNKNVVFSSKTSFDLIISIFDLVQINKTFVTSRRFGIKDLVADGLFFSFSFMGLYAYAPYILLLIGEKKLDKCPRLGIFHLKRKNLLKGVL